MKRELLIVLLFCFEVTQNIYDAKAQDNNSASLSVVAIPLQTLHKNNEINSNKNLREGYAQILCFSAHPSGIFPFDIIVNSKGIGNNPATYGTDYTLNKDSLRVERNSTCKDNFIDNNIDDIRNNPQGYSHVNIITAIDDNIAEPNERFEVSYRYGIRRPALFPISTMYYTIIDSDGGISTPSPPSTLPPATSSNGPPQSVRAHFDKSTLNNLILTLTWEAPEFDSDEVTGYEYKIYEGDPTARVFPALIDWTMTGNVQEQDIHLESDARAYTVWLRAVTGAGKTQHQQSGVYVPDHIISVVLHTESETPVEFSLGQNYPNPFNPETAIRYALPQTGEVRLTVYDLLGHEVAVLVDGLQPAGFHTIRFDGSGLPSGTYVYRLQAGNRIFTRTMILVK